jgi:gamma-glutamyl-gamma-aminobutyrate hydrolase PuuD
MAKKADKILVLNGFGYGEALLGIGELDQDIATFTQNPEEYKLVLFTGGADVTPRLYGDTSPRGFCQCSPSRDATERIIFRVAQEAGVPMAGICRGLQFLNVMAGGKLIHHLDKHAGGFHEMEVQKDNILRQVNTLHHQMVIPPKDAFIIGWSKDKLSKVYYGNEDKEIKWRGPEVEAVIYPNITACGVQYHPEMMPKRSAGYEFFYEMVYNMLVTDMKTFVKIYTGKQEMSA